ncbi:MAG TPA: radical SAM protein [Bacillota bacterium]|jgi:MoaA/NifB/PqqE/SkfB family radical SAM enzyme
MARSPIAAHETAFLDASIHRMLRDALRITLRDPAEALFIWRTLRRQRAAAARRQRNAAAGLPVPPLMIASVTRQCNLHCLGCYDRAQGHRGGGEMSRERLEKVIAEARDLGMAIILLAGGEPLLRPDILDITAAFPEVIFPVFTNGLLIDEAMTARLKRQRNVIPVVSLEGDPDDTDQRRGEGVFERLRPVISGLAGRGVFFGVSLTVTARNHQLVTDEAFIRSLMGLGARLFFFVEYVPVAPGTDDWVLSDGQRASLLTAVEGFRAHLPGLFVAFPGDEEASGGCVAAGRGFIHVSPEGRVEPCPFAPYSDADLGVMTLSEALRSPLLRTIRESRDRLRETRGGCALWREREWVSGLEAGRNLAPGSAAR